jgi:hypothetical protein
MANNSTHGMTEVDVTKDLIPIDVKVYYAKVIFFQHFLLSAFFTILINLCIILIDT